MTSWISTFFAPSQPSHFVSSNSHKSPNSLALQKYLDEQDEMLPRGRRKEPGNTILLGQHQEEKEEKEKEDRPPYLHVGLS